MKRLPTRRDFIRKTSTAGLTAAAVTALGRSAKAFAAHEKVQLGWIGCGGRSSGLMQHMMNNVPDAKVVGVCDLIPERMEKAKKFWDRDKPNGYLDFHKMFEKEKIDGVMAVVQICKHAEPRSKSRCSKPAITPSARSRSTRMSSPATASPPSPGKSGKRRASFSRSARSAAATRPISSA
jgi:hypothetical protein